MIRLIVFLFVIACSYSFAFVIDKTTIKEQANKTAISQLVEIQNTAMPEYSAYLAAGLIWIPLPTSSRLQTEWGIHDGYAFRQRLALWQTAKFGSFPLKFGLGWWGERHGWDNQDFLFIPHRGEFGRINQVHSFAVTAADSGGHRLIGMGMQYLTDNEHSVRWFLLGTWRQFSFQPIFFDSKLKYANIMLNLQSRELRGGVKEGWQSYLPDLAFTYYSKDSLSFFISQNLYKQKFYAEGLTYIYPQKFSWAALKYYPDPSRILLALEATLTRKERDYFFGGGLSIPFFRISYNSATEYAGFFNAKGIWIAELRLSIGTAGNSFFEVAAPQPAPKEISQIKAK